jgi:hypothetical protein
VSLVVAITFQSSRLKEALICPLHFPHTSTGFYQDCESLESFFNCFGWNINQKFKKSGFGRTMDKKFSFKSNTQFINQLVWTQSAAQHASQKDTKPKNWI